MTKISLLGICLLFPFIVFSQWENRSYYPDSSALYLPVHKAGLLFSNNNFIKNNEYFSDQTNGLTFIGTVIQPEIVFALGEKVQLYAGWHFLNYFGSGKLQRSLPVFRMDYRLNKNAVITMGEIRGKLDHQLIEPMYSMDNYFLMKPEYGFRFRYDNTKLKNDFWLDWQQFLEPGAGGNEQFVMGNALRFAFLQHKKMTFSFNNQFTVKHIGGQSSGEKQPLQTYLNEAPGLEISYAATNKILQKITFNSWYILSTFDSDTAIIPFKNGYGLYSSLFIELKNLDIMLNWWKAHTYFSPLGEYLFQSISNYKSGFVDTERYMLAAKCIYHYEIDKGVDLGFRFDAYYDLQKSDFNFFYGINLKTNIFYR